MALFSSPILRRLPVLAGLFLTTQAALAGTLTGVSVTPADNTAGATTSYTFTYTTESDLNADTALLYVIFPPEFSVADGACDRIVSFTLNPDPGGVICRDAYGGFNEVGFAVNTSLDGGESIPGGTQVSVVVGGVTNPVTPGNYDFDPFASIGFDSGIYTANMADPMLPFEIDSAAIQTVTIGTPASSSASSVSSIASSVVSSSAASSSGALVNGSCGIAHTGTFAVDPPPETRCETGTEASYSANPTDYTWDCNGENGGSPVSCSANLGFLISPPTTAGGTFDCVPDLVTYGDPTTCTAVPNSGYEFSGWGAGDCNGVLTVECVVNNVVNDPVLEALFATAPHVITTNVTPAGAGSSISCTANPVPNGGNSTCTYTAPNPGYTFANWSGACSGATCVLTNVTSAKSVKATFIAPTFNITVDTIGSGSASCSPNPVTSGGNTTCTASADVGHSFTGWSGDCTGTGCALTNVTANKMVTANFAINTYSISGSAEPLAGGTVDCSESVAHGSSGSCTATANAGYTFGSWTDCPSASGNSCSFTNVTANQSVTGNFTVGSYEVIPFAQPENAGVVECTSPVNYGSTGTCTATAKAGYRVKEWFWPDCTGASCNFSLNANSAINSLAGRAYFELIPTYNVSTSVWPADSGRVSCTKDIPDRGTANCDAIAKDGFEFTGWGGDCSGTGPRCELASVTGNKLVTATFEQVQAAGFNITVGFVNAVGKSEGSPIAGDQICSASNPVTAGTTVRCNADNYQLPGGNRFRGWEGGCSRVEGRTCVIENMSSDKQLRVKMGVFGSDSMSIIKVEPRGAGSVWCTASWANLPIFSPTITDYCQAEANQGYAFDAFVKVCSIAPCPGPNQSLEARFKQVPNSPSVSCENCNSSITDTFTTTAKTTSKTSEPDNQGNSTQTNVATTTNTQSGVVTTSVTVGAQTSDGTLQPGGSVSTNDPMTQITVGDTSTTLLTSNTTTGQTSTAVISPTGNTVTTTGSGNANNKVTTVPGQSTAITQSTQGTALVVSDSNSGVTLGSVIQSSTTIFSYTKRLSLRMPSNLSSLVMFDSTVTLVGDRTPEVSPVVFSSDVKIQGHTVFVSQDSASTDAKFEIKTPQASSKISGKLSQGFSGGVNVGSGSSLQGDGTLIGGEFVQTKLTIDNVNIIKPASGKTSVKDTREVLIDITGGALQSVQIYSEAAGVVEVFRPQANGFVLTDVTANDASLDMTLTFPVAQ